MVNGTMVTITNEDVAILESITEHLENNIGLELRSYTILLNPPAGFSNINGRALIFFDFFVALCRNTAVVHCYTNLRLGPL